MQRDNVPPKQLSDFVKITNWNPFPNFVEDAYSPYARSLRNSLSDEFGDVKELVDGEIHNGGGRVGLLDYATFMVFPLILNLFFKLGNRFYKKDEDKLALGVIFVLAFLPRLLLAYLFATSGFLGSLPMTLYFQKEGSKLKKIIDAYEKDQINVLSLTFHGYDGISIDPVAGLGLYARQKQSTHDENKRIERLVFGVSTLSIVHYLTAQRSNTTLDYQSIITLCKDNPRHIQFWKAMRKLNIGHVNERIRKEEFEYSQTAEVVNKARYVYQVLWRAAKTGNGDFSEYLFPKEVIAQIVQKAFEAELSKAVNNEIAIERDAYAETDTARVSFSDNFKQRQMPAGWLFEGLAKDQKSKEIGKFIGEGVSNNKKRLLAMKENAFLYQLFAPEVKNNAKKQPENIISLRR